MVDHIKKLIVELVKLAKSHPASPNYDAMFDALNEELACLDTRDFLPSARFEFAYTRKLIATRMITLDSTIRSAERLALLLDQFGGVASHAESRSFAFIRDLDLRTIIERDYRELSLMLFPSGAWKSTVIIAGSILEAILFDQLTLTSVRIAQAEGAQKAPKGKGGIVKPIVDGDWKLVNLIQVAADLRLLPLDREKSIDQTLRDYRNFVHPKKEIRAAHAVSEAEALMAKGSLDGVCNFLERMP